MDKIKEILDKDPASFVHLMEHDRIRIATQIRVLIDKEKAEIVRFVETQIKNSTSTITQLDFLESPFWQALKKGGE